jgi:hypothetical protein
MQHEKKKKMNSVLKALIVVFAGLLIPFSGCRVQSRKDKSKSENNVAGQCSGQ